MISKKRARENKAELWVGVGDNYIHNSLFSGFLFYLIILTMSYHPSYLGSHAGVNNLL